ncbi:MAG: hypothetical protein LUO91_02510 [Methanomicrobiales archaeon]|nr:hypothetical protein [Methanomicrobiales archaeon]
MILLLWVLYGVVVMATSALPAFPGAEGFGTDTLGGRGGTVYVVTNLNDSGPGSLRAAIDASGPRIVVFATGGTIICTRTLELNNPYITIAGQTAPGDGITVKGELAVKTHDVVVRYMRFRPGHPSAILPPDKRKDTHAINIVDNSYNVVVDHCSLSWGIDEDFSVYGEPHDVTLQWSIVAEGLYNASLAKPNENGYESGHSMGALIGSENGITLHHNLMAHNDQRNPRLKADGTVDVVNNVVYNYGYSAGAATDDRGLLRINYVGNYVKKGTQSKEVAELELGHPTDKTAKGYAVYVEGNIGPHRTSDSQDQRLVVDRGDWNHLTTTRNSAPLISSTSAAVAYEQVLNGAGAVFPKRDAVDQRIVTDVRTMGGAILTTPSQRGGWPVLASGTPPVDSDRDGMPDTWETAAGLNPRDASDAKGDRDGDGYTNVEEYANSIIPGEVKVGAVTIPSEGGAFPGERVRFTAVYQGTYLNRPSTDVIREMRFLVSTSMKEEIPQVYCMVTQVKKGVFQASIQPAPKQLFTGAVPLGVGTAKKDGTSLASPYFRFNTGESWVSVDPATGSITVTWDVTFLDAYQKRTGQSVFTYVAGRNNEKDMGKYDPIDNYGWHRKGSWSVWDPASPLRYGFLQESYLETDGYHTQGRTCPLTPAGTISTAKCTPWTRADLTYAIDTNARQFHGYDAYVYLDNKQQGWVAQSLIQNDRYTSWVRECPIVRNSGPNWKACSWKKVDLSGAGLGHWKAYAAYTLTQGTTRSLTQSMIKGEDFASSYYRTCRNSATGAPDWSTCTAWSGPANVSAMKGLDGTQYPAYTSYSVWNGNEVSLVQRLIAVDGVTEKSRTCKVVNGRPDWTSCDGTWTTTNLLTSQAWAKDANGKIPKGFTELGVIYYYPKGETVPVAFEPRV